MSYRSPTPAPPDSGSVSIRRKIIAYSTTSRSVQAQLVSTSSTQVPEMCNNWLGVSPVPPLPVSQSVGLRCVSDGPRR